MNRKLTLRVGAIFIGIFFLFLFVRGIQTIQDNNQADLEKRIEIIKKLLKKRIYSDPELFKIYSSGEVPKIDELPDMILLGLPEATIVTIIETYWGLKKKTTLSDVEIFNSIERYRKIMFPESGPLPARLTLFTYIKYRIKFEHGHGKEINDDILKEDIEIANNYYKNL